MQLLSREELQQLAAWQKRPSVSIYIPLSRAGAEIQQTPIRLKNQLRHVEECLVREGIRRPEAKALLEPAWALQQDPRACTDADGLALFISPGFFRLYRAAQPFAELSTVSSNFHIKPLVNLLVNDTPFYLLTLSQNRVQLFQGSSTSLAELDLPEKMPRNFEQSLGPAQFDRSLQMHTSAPRSAGQGWTEMAHGHATQDEQKTWIEDYVRRIARHVAAYLKADRFPLVFAAVEYYHPVFRAACPYPHMAAVGILGSPDHLTRQQLHQSARDIAKQWVQEHLKRAAAHYREMRGLQRTSTNLAEIVAAAHRGRVESVFTVLGTQVWGRYTRETRETQIHSEPREGDEDLLNLAVEQTLVHGGDTYVTRSEEMPTDHPATIAAVFRW